MIITGMQKLYKLFIINNLYYHAVIGRISSDFDQARSVRDDNVHFYKINDEVYVTLTRSQKLL